MLLQSMIVEFRQPYVVDPFNQFLAQFSEHVEIKHIVNIAPGFVLVTFVKIEPIRLEELVPDGAVKPG